MSLNGDPQELEALLVSQQEERRRVADILHDDAIQVMFGAAFLIEALVRRRPAPELEADLRDIASDLTAAGERLKRLMQDLQASLAS